MHPVGRRHHYSNPGYTLLGSLVEAVRGASWEEVLRREILEPLAMHRTSAQPRAPHAGGWAVHPWADVMLPEPSEDLGLMAPAGQLWSTAADLCRFAAFLAEGDERVLSAASVREMRTPVRAAGGRGVGQRLRAGDADRAAGRPHPRRAHGFAARLRRRAVGERGRTDVAAVALANATSGPLTGIGRRRSRTDRGRG